MYALQRLFYGPLRPIEIEQLSEKAWYAVLDTLLAMPSFREDVGGWLLAMFTLLLAAKVWGWIGEGRVDVLEQGQPPANPTLFHTRLATSLVLSVLFDVFMLDYCIETVLADPRPGMMVIFTFEFAIVAVFSIFTLARYGLAVVQGKIEKKQLRKAIEERKTEIRAERAAARQNETADGTPAPASPPSDEPIEVDENEVDVPGWEDKRRYLFFLEVLTDFIKLLIYIVFFTVSITFNGLPMHIMRDVYMTFASFSKRVADYVAYRKATSDMNSRYPDATTEEIRGDSCIVCRENMLAWDETPSTANTQQPAGQDQQAQAQANAPAAPTAQPQRRRDEGLRAKKLPCGHILHLRCLKAWLERQQVCPTCRRPVVVPSSNPNAPQQGNPPGQAGQQQAQRGQAPQRQGRARILNFGPIRIGFLNGPGDQIQNLLRQMQNQNQNQPNQANQQQRIQAGGDAGNHPGPNHLGLQVPYANGGPNNGAVAPTGLRATVPTHIQLQQIEQRLVQESQALGLEHQQLNTLRAMEGHLAYLRTLQQQQQQQNGAQPQARQAPPQLPVQVLPQPYGTPLFPPMGFPPMQQFPQPQPQPFHGSASQMLRRGEEGLPEGLVLPDGWTLMPLRPMGGQAAIAPSVDMQQVSGEMAGSSQEVQAGDEVPRDENGSPLFVPTVPEPAPTANGAPTPSDVRHESSSSTTQTAAGTSSPPAPSQSEESRPPWNAEGGWSFADPPPDANGHADASSSNGAPKPPGEEGSGKGKGKQPAVEDAPDEGT